MSLDLVLVRVELDVVRRVVEILGGDLLLSGQTAAKLALLTDLAEHFLLQILTLLIISLIIILSMICFSSVQSLGSYASETQRM